MSLYRAADTVGKNCYHLIYWSIPLDAPRATRSMYCIVLIFHMSLIVTVSSDNRLMIAFNEA